MLFNCKTFVDDRLQVFKYIEPDVYANNYLINLNISVIIKSIINT